MSTPTAGTLSAPESLPAPETPDNDEELELLAEFAEVTNPRQRAFLAAYVMAKGVRGAQRLSGVSRITHCRWLSKDALYRECFELARSVIAAEAEEEAYRRAFLGCDMPISYHGNIRSWYKSYSDALAIFVLKA
jgi:hypothetical protein